MILFVFNQIHSFFNYYKFSSSVSTLFLRSIIQFIEYRLSQIKTLDSSKHSAKNKSIRVCKKICSRFLNNNYRCVSSFSEKRALLLESEDDSINDQYIENFKMDTEKKKNDIQKIFSIIMIYSEIWDDL